VLCRSTHEVQLCDHARARAWLAALALAAQILPLCGYCDAARSRRRPDQVCIDAARCLLLLLHGCSSSWLQAEAPHGGMGRTLQSARCAVWPTGGGRARSRHLFELAVEVGGGRGLGELPPQALGVRARGAALLLRRGALRACAGAAPLTISGSRNLW